MVKIIMLSANILFKGDDTGYFIKFGQKEHLKQIQNGIVRFSELTCFSANKKQTAIYDKYEGIKYLKHQRNGKTVFERIKEMQFISCFSYFIKKDVLHNRIVSPQIFEERNWSYVLFIIESDKFRTNIESALSNFRHASNIVTYVDFKKDQENLTIFNKSDEYEFEKEFRFVFYPNDELIFLKKNKRTVNIKIEKVNSLIIPTKEFVNCFSIE